MKTKSQAEIDATLHILGGVQPPPGFAGRVNARLQAPRRKLRTIHFVSLATVAASIAISTFALSPALRESVLRSRASSLPSPVLIAHPAGDFGAASAVRVPTMPLPVVAIPVGQGQGRGHTRSTGATPPVDAGASRKVLPHRAAALTANRAAASTSGQLTRTSIPSGNP
jgi:hypothetical protein